MVSKAVAPRRRDLQDAQIAAAQLLRQLKPSVLREVLNGLRELVVHKDAHVTFVVSYPQQTPPPVVKKRPAAKANAQRLAVRAPARVERGPVSAEEPLKLAGGGHGPLISVAEAESRLDAAAKPVSPELWAESELLGPEAVSVRLGISRTSLHNWRKTSKVIALQKGMRNHVYPARQFGRSAPLPGIEDVLSALDSPEAAWEWLVTPNVYTGNTPPLLLLEKGEVEPVLRAADSGLDYA